MKRFLAILLTLSLFLTLASCVQPFDKDEDSNVPEET